MQIQCPICKTQIKQTPEDWRCQCGEAWEPIPENSFDNKLIDPSKIGLWRYGSLFGLDFETPAITMGAGWTPLIAARFNQREIFIKLEYISPTGSFKDRGTEIEINTLIDQGVKKVIDDSSGNAGSALAAYAARSGLEAEIYVPHYASENKKKQIAIYGAEVNSIMGLRQNAKNAAIAAISDGVVYASHAYNPSFLLGQESVAWEIWEQLNGQVPDWYIVPVGQGVHLLGAWLGFCRLKEAGLIDKTPRMVAVQPSILNPISSAWKNKSQFLPELNPGKPSIAEGLAITKPVRWKRILQAINESDGMAFSVEEKEIFNSQINLAKMGFFAEPSSAVVLAALPKVLKEAEKKDLIVMPLTGSGLKGAPKIE